MGYDAFWQSLLANGALALSYVAYKLCKRVSDSKCHYTRADGLEIHLADPEEDVDVDAVNSLFEKHGMTMRLRDRDSPRIV